MIRILTLVAAVLIGSCAMTEQASALGGRYRRSYCRSGHAYQAPVQSFYRSPGYSSYYRSPTVYRGYGGLGRSYYGYPGYRSGGISIGIGRGYGYGFGPGIGYGSGIGFGW